MLERDVGDFVLYRADGQFAYQLAVVVDDAEQGVTDVVRGADLLDSTPRQLYLQQLLGYPSRVICTFAALNAAGEKLSKQTGALPWRKHRRLAPRAFLSRPAAGRRPRRSGKWNPTLIRCSAPWTAAR